VIAVDRLGRLVEQQLRRADLDRLAELPTRVGDQRRLSGMAYNVQVNLVGAAGVEPATARV
jgi:hypothetical protein